MPATGLWNARIGYCDREDSIAYLHLCFGADVDVQALLNALATDSRLQAVTDAQRCVVALEKRTYIDSARGTASGLHVGTLIFSTDDPDDFGILDVPGMTPGVALQHTCFAGKAIDLLDSQIVALAALVIADPPLITPSGNPFRMLVAGGYRQVWQELDRRSG